MKLKNKLLADSHAALEKKGWCRGELVNVDGRHCSIGAIGYARWGDEYDRAVRSARWSGYEELARDARCAKAVEVLHAELAATGQLRPDPDPYGWHDGTRRMINDIVAFNDNCGRKTKVMATFEKASGVAAKAAAAVKNVFTPKQPEVKVEYIPAVAQEEAEAVTA